MINSSLEDWQNGYCNGLENRGPYGLEGSNPSSSAMEDFNDEPVYYCTHCLSLRIESVNLGIKDILYCGKCKDTDIGQTDFDTWDKMYVDKYGHHFMEENREGLTHKEAMDKELREILNLR